MVNVFFQGPIGINGFSMVLTMGCVNLSIKLYFFGIFDFIFQKITKTTKKYPSHEKIKKLLPGTYILIYVLWSQ